jgi:hypothetical protein
MCLAKLALAAGFVADKPRQLGALDMKERLVGRRTSPGGGRVGASIADRFAR